MLNRVLALDTATSQGFVSLRCEGEFVVHRLAARRHSAELPRVLREVLAGAGLDSKQLDLIAVGCGPGSYTGLRVGISLAKGLSLGAGVPLVGVSSLLAYAHERADLRCLSAFDARAGGVYFYDDGPQVLPLKMFAEHARQFDVVVSPDARVIRERVEACCGILPLLWEEREAQPALLIDEACRKFLKGQSGAEALYLRKTHAERERLGS